MSPPIISASSNTPTQSRQHQPDRFSPGASRPNTMSRTLDLETAIEEWVNVLTSPLSTPSERINILNDIEKTLVTVTDPSRSSTACFLPSMDESAAMFWALQATAGYSLAEVLLAHVYRLHLDLERENELCSASQGSSMPTGSSHTVSDVQRQRVHLTVSELCMSITILQGLTLCSKISKRITQRKSSLELLLAITLSDYCTQLLPPILSPSSPTSSSFAALPDSPPTPTAPSPSKDHPSEAPLSLPSGFALDLLMCILVDSPLAQERFADMGGIHQIVQLSHKCADTVTTPASTPVSVTSPSFAQVVARGCYVTALKQTDLGCLEFRYFWSQLQGEKERRGSQETVSGATSVAVSATTSVASVEEASTPKASPRKRVSRADLRAQRKAEEDRAETPKATMRRRAAPPPSTTRATSEEAPSRPGSSRTESAGAVVGGSPRKLRHSTSVAELRKKPTSLSRAGPSPPPLPPLPAAVTESPITFQHPTSSRRERSTSRPSTAESGTSLPRERVRRSTVSDADPAPVPGSEERGSDFNPSRPGMSSRDRPRIPSPLKAPSVQPVDDRLRHKPQSVPSRRLRASTSSTPFDVDENRNPFTSSSEVVRSRQSSEAPLTPSTSQRSMPSANSTTFAGEKGRTSMSSASSTSFGGEKGRSSLSGSGAGMRIPPSPAVRRAQLARARSLSPQKMGRALVESEEF